MYAHNLDPILFSIGPISIRWYGLVYALGFIIVYWQLHKHRESLDISKQQVENIVLALFVGLLAGARIFHFVFSQPSVFWTDPLELFLIWHGGMSFFGALVGCFAAVVWYLKRIGKGWKSVADVIVLPVAAILIFGRLANFINGELVGTVSTLPWCVVFPAVDNLCRHPYQIYAALSHTVLFGALLWLNKLKKERSWNPGIIFLAFVIGYSFLRFLTDFWRADPHHLGLTVWQWVSVGTIVLTGAAYYFRKNS